MTDQVTTKVCGKCKVEKLVMLFCKDKSRKDGLSNSCRDCGNKKNSEYYKNNKEKILDLQKEKGYVERKRVCQRTYYANNKEKISIKNKNYREANKDKIIIKARVFNSTNRIEANAYARAYRNKNRDYFLSYSANRRKYGIDNLTDAYVVSTLKIKLSKCPQELIELKRINLLITREIRNQQQCQN